MSRIVNTSNLAPNYFPQLYQLKNGIIWSLHVSCPTRRIQGGRHHTKTLTENTTMCESRDVFSWKIKDHMYVVRKICMAYVR